MVVYPKIYNGPSKSARSWAGQHLWVEAQPKNSDLHQQHWTCCRWKSLHLQDPLKIRYVGSERDLKHEWMTKQQEVYREVGPAIDQHWRHSHQRSCNFVSTTTMLNEDRQIVGGSSNGGGGGMFWGFGRRVLHRGCCVKGIFIMPHDLNWTLGGELGICLNAERMMVDYVGRRLNSWKPKCGSTWYTKLIKISRARFQVIL